MISAKQLSVYFSLLRQPALRVLFSGLAVAFIGEGMSTVSIPWLTIRVSTPGAAGLWTGLSLAAYTFPSVFGGFVFARFFRHRPPTVIAQYAVLLRCSGLLVVGVLATVGLLTPVALVAVIASTALLGTWATSAQYTLVSRSLPTEQKLAGNALIASLSNLGIIIGAAVAGFLAAIAGPQVGILIHAGSLIVLATIYRFLTIPGAAAVGPAGPGSSRETGIKILFANRQLLALIALTVSYYLLSGPVQAALPLFVVHNLHASSQLLGTAWAASGVGAIIGGMAFGVFRSPSPGRTIVAVMFGTSVCGLLLGSATSGALCVLWFSLGRLAFAPFPPLSLTMIQAQSSDESLAEVLAARGSLILVAPPIGQAVGGVLVTLVGARSSILLSGASTLALALLLAVGLIVRGRSRVRSQPHSAPVR